MRVNWTHLLLLGITFANPGAICAFGQDEKVAPDFREVYDLVKEHLAEANVVELNRAAVQGFVGKLSPRVAIVPGNEATNAIVKSPLVAGVATFDRMIGYVRIGRVGDGLADALKTAYSQLDATNKLKGLVLDLRYGSGTDYSSVVQTADLFSRKKQPALNWGEGMVETKENPNPIGVPVAVLVNGETAGAAEALAALLREIGAALLLGNNTAGQAMISRDFPLQNGDRLRIAVSPIELGDGGKLTGQGVSPDISVRVSPQDERIYFTDAYTVMARTNPVAGLAMVGSKEPGATNRAGRRPRMNEAELVRERREGGGIEPEIGVESGPARPLVQDPVLARALDVLKGLAVIRRTTGS